MKVRNKLAIIVMLAIAVQACSSTREKDPASNKNNKQDTTNVRSRMDGNMNNTYPN